MKAYDSLLGSIFADRPQYLRCVKVEDDQLHYQTPPLVDFSFPPAFVPLWCEQSDSLYGAWFNPYSATDFIFTYLALDGRPSLEEIACNTDQLVLHRLFKCVDNGEDPEAVNLTLMELLGLTVADLNLASLESGNHIARRELYQKYGRLPQGVLGKYYPVHIDNQCGSPTNYCEFECSDALIEHWKAEGTLPDWFDHSNQPQKFQRYLDQGEPGKAWRTLNSTGWYVSDASKCLKSLVDQSGDPLVKLLYETWREWEFLEDQQY